MNNIPNIIYLSHGGGPLPLLGDESHVEMISYLQEITKRIPKPSAILVISAHWEENIPTITSSSHPSLIYDYYGFPEEAYSIKYPCKGEENLASKIYNSLDKSNINARLDGQAGFDHGMFVPLKTMYPEADIPCVQLSLVNNLDPITHIEIGQALRHLDYSDLLVIGSGFSFHNMKAFFIPDTIETKTQNESFENWLLDLCSNASIDEEERKNWLVRWEQAPFARYCHPREEHLLPLHVCYGLAGRYCSESFELKILNKKSSIYLWKKEC